jgi:hypothetical protein
LAGVVAALIAATSASAAVRYAAPSGTGSDPCASSTDPCTIYTAASVSAPGTTVASGDEVVITPGAYSDTAGDLGPQEFVQLAPGIKVLGTGGSPRPTITLNENKSLIGAFVVEEEDVLSHVEIDTAVSRSNVEVFDGIMDDVIVRSAAPNAIACVQFGGIVRDSACLSTGSDSAAVGMSLLTSGTHTATLRNVTAVATGSSSRGISFAAFGNTTYTIDAESVIARGESKDVEAAGLSLSPHTPGTGASVVIDLDHSNYATVEAKTDAGGGSATVTAAGSGSNQVAPPQLASDGIHQLAGSPTVDQGATDTSSGTTDVDGQLRTIGLEADIGADELADSTTTTVACAPATVTLGETPGASTCTATVADTSAATAPTGEVSFSSSGPGAFGVGGTCALLATSPIEASCQLSYAPSMVGSGTHTIEAVYAGDGSHEGSKGSAAVAVKAAAGTKSEPEKEKVDRKKPGSKKPKPGKNPHPASPPDTKIKRKPEKRTARRLAKFTFSSSQPHSTFQCRLGKGRFKPCSSPFKRRVGQGRHVFRVRAVSQAGLVDPTPAAFRWKVLALRR